ncbi:MAG: hypothetical protein Q9205_005508 [Flavoplaca limonia]
MAKRPSKDQITGWSAKTLHEGMKQSIISDLAKVMLKNPEVHDQVIKIHSSLGGVGRCLGRLWTVYQNKNFMYLVDPRDREVLYPDYKERCNWLKRSELHGYKPEYQPEELDLRTFVVDACEGAASIVTESKTNCERQFNFMGLPGELRNMIYGYLFQGAEISISVRVFRKYILYSPCHTGTLLSNGRKFTAPDAVKQEFRVPKYDSKSRLHWDLYYAEFENTVHKDHPKGISTAILRVNSHIHKEAEVILYKSHTFDFGLCPTAALAFFQTLPRAALPFIPRIRFDLYCTKWHNEAEFSKTCNALIKLWPDIRLSTKLTLDPIVRDRDVTSWPFVRSLARLQGVKSLRTEKGKKFASDFAELIKGANRVLDRRSGALKVIEYTVR